MMHGPLPVSLPLPEHTPGIGKQSAVHHDGREHPYLTARVMLYCKWFTHVSLPSSYTTYHA